MLQPECQIGPSLRGVETLLCGVGLVDDLNAESIGVGHGSLDSECGGRAKHKDGGKKGKMFHLNPPELEKSCDG